MASLQIKTADQLGAGELEERWRNAAGRAGDGGLQARAPALRGPRRTDSARGDRRELSGCLARIDAAGADQAGRGQPDPGSSRPRRHGISLFGAAHYLGGAAPGRPGAVRLLRRRCARHRADARPGCRDPLALPPLRRAARARVDAGRGTAGRLGHHGLGRRAHRPALQGGRLALNDDQLLPVGRASEGVARGEPDRGRCRHHPGRSVQARLASLRWAAHGRTSMTEGSKDVRVERDGRAMTITLDRPDDQNRLTHDVLLTLQSLVDRLAGDEETQAVVITGSGAEFFSMGILNPVVRASYTKEQILELVRTANRLYDAIEVLPQIVIAAFN